MFTIFPPLYLSIPCNILYCIHSTAGKNAIRFVLLFRQDELDPYDKLTNVTSYLVSGHVSFRECEITYCT
jgi:hypothetical protein